MKSPSAVKKMENKGSSDKIAWSGFANTSQRPNITIEKSPELHTRCEPTTWLVSVPRWYQFQCSPRSNDLQRFKLRMKFERIRIQRGSATWDAIMEVRKKCFKYIGSSCWGLCWGFMRIPPVWYGLPELGSSSASKLSKNQTWPSIAAPLFWRRQAPTEQLDTTNIPTSHADTHTHTKKTKRTNELRSRHYFSNAARIEPPWTATCQETREEGSTTNITWKTWNKKRWFERL